jgi:hypothetical protein
VLAAQIRTLRTRLVLLQDANDLLFRVARESDPISLDTELA